MVEMQSFPLTIALLLMLCQKGEETWLKNYCRQFYRNFYGPSKAAAAISLINKLMGLVFGKKNMFSLKLNEMVENFKEFTQKQK